MSGSVDHTVSELLACMGVKIRGRNRADCVWCNGRRTISYTDQVYFCHRCGVRGNGFTLARELRLAPRLSPTEARTLCLERERAEAAASTFLVRVRGARFGLAALHIELLNLRDEVHEQLTVNPGNETAWETITYLHTELPRVRAELILLNEGRIEDRVIWFQAGEEMRHKIADRIVRAGGGVTFDGKWAELE